MDEKEQFVVANYNMTFDNGQFKKDKIYKYRYVDKEEGIIYVTTEEKKEQMFYFSEFNMLFSLF